MADNSNKRFWERVARLYTPLHEKGNKELYDELCKNIRPLFKDNHKVLELACGTGQITSVLADKTKIWYATDFSKKMVKEAKMRLNHECIKFEVQDATQLTYEDEAFDVVVIANALHIMPSPDSALKEIKRVLKADGVLIAPTFVYDGKINRVRIWFMEKIGFKTFNKWKTKEYKEYVETHGFQVKKKMLLNGRMLPECVLICKKD